jgi:hypothetical protein
MKDYTFGKQQEEKQFEAIKTFFKDDIKTTDKFCSYDFESETSLYELKSRNNKYSAYPTTLIPFDKINENKKLIFLFNFVDGLYYIQYCKEEFKNFQLEPFKRHKRYGFNDKEKLYYFIPIEKLIKIN